MKKSILLLSTIIIAAVSSYAQEGSWYIGGNAGFRTNKTVLELNNTSADQNKSTEWTFAPEVGTFITSNLQLGLGLNFGGSKNTNYQSLTDRTTTNNRFGGTLYSRYFFGEGNFKPFLGINVSVLPGSRAVTNSIGVNTTSNTLDWGANLNAGFAYALNSRVTAVGSFGAVGFSQNIVSSNNGNAKVINSGFGFENAGTLGNRFTIGIYYTFCN